MKWLVVIGVVAVVLALAWWSSGRARPRGHFRRSMSDAEKDAHQHHTQRDLGAGGGGWL